MQKVTYAVAPGVVDINGQKVPPSRRVSLTEAEALYDLAHGRISVPPLVAKPPRKRRSKVAS